jgi:hypothetical protein
MGFGDGRELMGIGATSAGAAADNGGLMLASVSILLGTAVPFSPLGLVAERSSIQAVSCELVVDACQGWLELEQPRHQQRLLALPPSWTRLCP